MEGTTGPTFYMILFFVFSIALVLLFVNNIANNKKTTSVVFSQKNDSIISVNEKLALLIVDTAGIAASLASIDKSLKEVALKK